MIMEMSLSSAHCTHLEGFNIRDKDEMRILMKPNFKQVYSLVTDEKQKNKSKRQTLQESVSISITEGKRWSVEGETKKRAEKKRGRELGGMKKKMMKKVEEK